MSLSNGPCLINGLQVVEIAIMNMPTTTGIVMSADYALLVADPKTTQVIATHGKCSAVHTNWSNRTMAIVTQLIESMEQDLLSRHFDVEATPDEKEGIDDEGIEPTGQEGPGQI